MRLAETGVANTGLRHGGDRYKWVLPAIRKDPSSGLSLRSIEPVPAAGGRPFTSIRLSDWHSLMTNPVGEAVRLCVGGTTFAVPLAAITDAGESFLASLVSGRLPSSKDASGAFIIDRSPELFADLLRLLLEGTLPARDETVLALADEAMFYQLEPCLAALGPACELIIALLGTRHEEERAAFAFHASEDGRPLRDDVLLWPHGHDADAFVYRADGPDAPPLLNIRRAVRFLGAPGQPSVASRDVFHSQLRALTRGALDGLDWRGVILAAGAVIGALMPLARLGGEPTDDEYGLYSFLGPRDYQEDGDVGRRIGLEFAHSDLDLFLVGLDEAAALAKMFHIAAVLRATGTVEQIVRTANALTFVCSHRTVQVVLRLYPSIAAVLTLFDVDCCACAWDGADVRALPRCCLALNRANVVDPVRETPSFDHRLLKYASRGFAIAVPGYTGSMAAEELSRPRALASGLARLVQLEAAASIPELTKLFSTHNIDSSTRANRPSYVYPGPEAARISARLEADDPVMYFDNTQGDAYGYNNLSSYVPWLAWGCDKPVAHVMMNLLVEPPFPVYWRWALPRGYIWHDPPADPAGQFREFRRSSAPMHPTRTNLIPRCTTVHSSRTTHCSCGPRRLCFAARLRACPGSSRCLATTRRWHMCWTPRIHR